MVGDDVNRDLKIQLNSVDDAWVCPFNSFGRVVVALNYLELSYKFTYRFL